MNKCESIPDGKAGLGSGHVWAEEMLTWTGDIFGLWKEHFEELWVWRPEGSLYRLCIKKKKQL